MVEIRVDGSWKFGEELGIDVCRELDLEFKVGLWRRYANLIEARP